MVLYIWRPDFAGALDAPHDLSIYHIDDEYSFSPIEVEIPSTERTLLTSVNQVFIHSPGLMDKKGFFNPNTEFVPNGVSYESFATPVPEPDDLRNIPHPRIGYVGWIKRMLDCDLLLQLMTANPQWSFVFVGPRSPHPDMTDAHRQMSGLPNAWERTRNILMSAPCPTGWMITPSISILLSCMNIWPAADPLCPPRFVQLRNTDTS